MPEDEEEERPRRRNPILEIPVEEVSSFIADDIQAGNCPRKDPSTESW